MTTKQKKTEFSFDIPADGMLGLLALGADGLTAWREKRAAVYGEDWRQKLSEELAWKEREAADVKMDDDDSHE